MAAKVCNSCLKQIAPEEEYTIIRTSSNGNTEAFLCKKCHDISNKDLLHETQNPNLTGALLAGLAGAAVTGLIWYYFVILTDIQFGLVSVLMGWFVGRAVVWGSGGKRGLLLQWMSVFITCCAMVFSEYLIFNHFFLKEFGVYNLRFNEFIELFGMHFSQDIGVFDALFFTVALLCAYSTPRRQVMKSITINRNTD